MLCGIDEAGRGPLAGPLMVAGVVLNGDIDGLNDSKKLTEKRRDELYEVIIKEARYHVVSFSALEIDTIGLSKLMTKALKEIMSELHADEYLFDGNSTFGVEGLQTLVKADATVESVKAASIIAKVTHDKVLYELDNIYPNYGFKNHKGYGTKAHIEAIKKYGYCEAHRKSFKVKALEGFEL
jgi:ribonuclease HII